MTPLESRERTCTHDVEAIYTGLDWTYCDNLIRYNYMHDIYGPGNGEALVVYLDDCVSGITVYGNLIVNTQAAVAIGGGRGCLVENNVFVDTHPAIGLHRDGYRTSLPTRRQMSSGHKHGCASNFRA